MLEQMSTEDAADISSSASRDMAGEAEIRHFAAPWQYRTSGTIAMPVTFVSALSSDDKVCLVREREESINVLLVSAAIVTEKLSLHLC